APVAAARAGLVRLAVDLLGPFDREALPAVRAGHVELRVLARRLERGGEHPRPDLLLLLGAANLVAAPAGVAVAEVGVRRVDVRRRLPVVQQITRPRGRRVERLVGAVLASGKE